MITVGVVVFACGSKDQSESTDEISGVYVREYSFKIAHAETGAQIGMRTVRDTIFIRPIEERFEVTNHKWKLNDYDRNGWQNMQHDDDRPMTRFNTTLDLTKLALVSDQSINIYWDKEKSAVFLDQSHYYLKTKD